MPRIARAVATEFPHLGLLLHDQPYSPSGQADQGRIPAQDDAGGNALLYTTFQQDLWQDRQAMGESLPFLCCADGALLMGCCTVYRVESREGQDYGIRRGLSVLKR